jgi:hypothetical protein
MIIKVVKSKGIKRQNIFRFLIKMLVSMTIHIDEILEANAHRVDWVLNRQNWDSPTPSPIGECASPPVRRGHTHIRERGWGSPNSDEALCTL